MKKVLVTGFGPFDGNTSNPSSSSLETLDRDDNVTLCPNIVVSCKEVDNLLSSIDPSVPRIHLGLNEKAKSFHIEQFAYNEKNFRIPDMDGLTPVGEVIHVDGPTRIATTMDVHALVSELTDQGLQVELSNDPGRYVCNYMYYKSLALTEKRNAIFVHLPPYDVIEQSVQEQFIKSLIEYVRHTHS